jgi:hypothetical protein
MHKRLNLPLSNGLIISSAKIRPGHKIAVLLITDFIESIRVLYDLEDKRLLTTKFGIDIPAKDLEAIAVAIGK